MSIPNLPVNFKDDILAASNPKRKYQQTFNSDGSVSLEDVTVYTQQGSEFGASQVNKTNGAINNIYNERVLDLDELELVTEPGYFVDALAVKEVFTELNGKLEAEPEDISLDLNTSQFTLNTTWAKKKGREVKVYPQVRGLPVNNRTICAGLPAPERDIILRDPDFGLIRVSTSGIMSVTSAGSTSSTYFYMPFSYWAAE